MRTICLNSVTICILVSYNFQMFLTISSSWIQAHPEAPWRKSCKSKVYRTFLFCTFQSCTQFAPVFKQPHTACTHHFAEFTFLDSARDNHPNCCQVLTLTSWKHLWDFNRQRINVDCMLCPTISNSNTSFSQITATFAPKLGLITKKWRKKMKKVIVLLSFSVRWIVLVVYEW